ncbi:MAG: response regulator [Pseudomonadales bacterium]|nr:response regulator [Pseudomonadales bacterium]
MSLHESVEEAVRSSAGLDDQTRNQRQRLVWLGVAFVIVVLLIDTLRLWREHGLVLQRAAQTTTRIARTFGDETGHTVRELDFALSDLAAWTRAADVGRSSDTALRSQLVMQLARIPAVGAVAVYANDGQLRASTGAKNALPEDISAQLVYSEARRKANADVFLGTVHGIDGTTSFVVSRSLPGDDGQSAGVAVVSLAPSYLARIYQELGNLPGASLQVSRDDGTRLIDYAPHAIGRLAGQPVVTARSVIDGYPLRIAVFQPRADAMAPWWETVRATAVFTVALIGTAVGLLYSLLRALRRLAQSQAQQQQAETRLLRQRSTDALGMLAASVAHDFNNVLSGIVGYGELIRTDLERDTLRSRYLERLLGAAERGRQLVQRVLTFDANRSLNYASVALAPVIDEVLAQLRTMLPANVKLEVASESPSAWVLGDDTEIFFVILNLCTNAMYAMPNGGSIAVRVAPVSVIATRELVVGHVEAGDWWCISIRDQGVGLDRTQVAAIFDPLHTTREKGRGTGLGLTIVRNIVLSMNGAIEVETTPGAGACFSIYWPQAAVGAAASGSVRSRGGASGQTILIVDDEPHLVALVEEMVASLGYEAIGFADPERALAVFRQDPQRFDLVLTDERMPSMSGMAIARAVRALRDDLPIIMLTGYRTAELDRDAATCGVAKILEKPVRSAQLAVELGKLFSRVVPRAG